jgi:formylglycine-generating enzyme required for sulfatase activity
MSRLLAATVLVACAASCRSGHAEESPPTPAPAQENYAEVPAGTFMRGAPTNEYCRRDEPVPSPASLNSGFKIGTHEITQRQFEDVMGYNPSFSAMCDDCPVDSVSWHEAAAYAVAASRARGLEECYECRGAHEDVQCTAKPKCSGLRLPTDEEWEYAVRAGTVTATYAGRITSCMSSDEVADQIAWYKANSHGQTHPVGNKTPNGWGLYDMLGNVAEWTQSGSRPPQLRGGSWYHNAERSRAAVGLTAPADSHLSYAGFRLVQPLGTDRAR